GPWRLRSAKNHEAQAPPPITPSRSEQYTFLAFLNYEEAIYSQSNEGFRLVCVIVLACFYADDHLGDARTGTRISSKS
ncbi:hypothetical protein KUCAC02_035336, partial [Chaenocephalus aceratus]